MYEQVETKNLEIRSCYICPFLFYSFVLAFVSGVVGGRAGGVMSLEVRYEVEVTRWSKTG